MKSATIPPWADTPRRSLGAFDLQPDHGGRPGAVRSPRCRSPLWLETSARPARLPQPDSSTSPSCRAVEWSEARALNDHDVAVGVANPGPDYVPAHAVRWARIGTITDLGTLSGGAASRANDVNNRGVVVGQSEKGTTDGTRTVAVRWDRKNRIHELGAVAGASTTSAMAVNRRGTVIGSAAFATRTRAVRWEATGRATLLPVGPGGGGR